SRPRVTPTLRAHACTHAHARARVRSQQLNRSCVIARALSLVRYRLSVIGHPLSGIRYRASVNCEHRRLAHEAQAIDRVARAPCEHTNDLGVRAGELREWATAGSPPLRLRRRHALIDGERAG